MQIQRNRKNRCGKYCGHKTCLIGMLLLMLAIVPVAIYVGTVLTEEQGQDEGKEKSQHNIGSSQIAQGLYRT